jgi:hypothetical protein
VANIYETATTLLESQAVGAHTCAFCLTPHAVVVGCPLLIILIPWLLSLGHPHPLCWAVCHWCWGVVPHHPHPVCSSSLSYSLHSPRHSHLAVGVVPVRLLLAVLANPAIIVVVVGHWCWAVHCWHWPHHWPAWVMCAIPTPLLSSSGLWESF